jgi:hypothetical protein
MSLQLNPPSARAEKAATFIKDNLAMRDKLIKRIPQKASKRHNGHI